MSTGKTTSVEKIIQRLKFAKNINKDQELAELIGVEPATLSAWKTRNSRSAVDKLVLFALKNGISEESLIGEGYTNTEPTKIKGSTVPLISWIQAGGWQSVCDNYQPGDGEDWIWTTKQVGKCSFALRVQGTSMEPEFREGDIIIVDPDYPAESGSLVVARLNGENTATFKKLAVDGANTYLEPLNPRYQPLDITGRDVTICGVVRQIIRDII